MRIPLLRIPFILAAEVLASSALMHGPPTDWLGKPPSFWHFEALRLQYWCLFGLSFTAIWSVEWMTSHRRFRTRVLAALGTACVLGTEVLTSIYSWKRLSPNETQYLGWPWPNLRQYTYDHLITWAVLIVFEVGFWYLWRKRKRHHPAIPTAAPPSL